MTISKTKKMRILFALNQKAGSGKGLEVIEGAIKRGLDLSHYDYTLESSLASIRESIQNEMCDIVVAVGGDGTILLIAKEIAGKPIKLGIIPRGSGNGYAKYLKIPTDIEEAIEVINRGKSCVVDTVGVNESLFVNVAGVGFDARVAAEFALSTTRGFATYFKLVVQKYFSYKSKVFVLEVDGVRMQEKAFLISFCNGSQYGNDAFIAPHASMNDGVMDVIILKPFPFFAIPSLAWRLFSGTFDRSSYVKVLRAEKVSVIGKLIEANVDGEAVTFAGDMTMRVIPSSLEVIVPE